MRTSSWLLLAFTALAVGLMGCAGYKVGSMLPPDIKTIYVPTFVNKTKEPLIEVETTAKVIEEIQKDGSLLIAPADRADSILNVTLANYDITPISFQSGSDSTAAREYRMTITASFVLERRSDNSVVAQSSSVAGQSVFQLIGDMSSSKLSGLPNTADDLALKIVEQLVENWPTTGTNQLPVSSKSLITSPSSITTPSPTASPVTGHP